MNRYLITGLPDFCQVSLVQTDSAGNPVNIVVWLPAKWNGNFQGVGGAGYTCGPYYTAPGIAGSLAEGVESGYATASTDCGVPISEGATGSWALKPDGTLNWPLFQDFASAGMHDMSVAEVNELAAIPTGTPDDRAHRRHPGWEAREGAAQLLRGPHWLGTGHPGMPVRWRGHGPVHQAEPVLEPGVHLRDHVVGQVLDPR